MKLKRFRVATLLAVLFACVIGINGCLQATDAVLGRYDAEHDEFVFLNLFVGIAGHNQGELDYLEKLWRNRAHLITPPMPQFFGKSSYVRLSASEYTSINLGGQRPLERSASAVALDQIRVAPGSFFLRGNDSLCYYDQITVPGKVVDQLLPVALQQVAPTWRDTIDAELKRRKEGGAIGTWDGLREVLNAELNSDSVKRPPENDDRRDPFRLLQADSLDRLRKGVEAKTLTITRDTHFLHLRIPLSADDVGQAMKSIREYRESLAKRAKSGSAREDQVSNEKVLSLFDVTSPDANTIEIKLDTVRLFRNMEELQKLGEAGHPPATQEVNGDQQKTVEFIRGRGLAIDEKTSINQVLADFKAGKLKAVAVDPAGTPGDGLDIPDR